MEPALSPAAPCTLESRREASTSSTSATWTPRGDTTADLRCACFVDARTGWAVGRDATILATRDGGETWRALDRGDRNLYGVAFADLNIGWVVGDGGTIRATRDGGATWT